LQDHGGPQRALSAALIGKNPTRNLGFYFGCLAKNEACLKPRYGRQMFDFVVIGHAALTMTGFPASMGW
jgi:hypothetical protein